MSQEIGYACVSKIEQHLALQLDRVLLIAEMASHDRLER